MTGPLGSCLTFDQDSHVWSFSHQLTYRDGCDSYLTHDLETCAPLYILC